MRSPAQTFLRITTLLITLQLLTGCGVNNLPSYDEQVKAQWAQVQNQYQRRADLIPNLVATVKGYASHEQETLSAVVEARAKVGTLQVNADIINNPEAMKQFEQAQAQLTGALSRLIAVAEAYPDLKANQNFMALQSQLEGTENRVAVAKLDYINAVATYNKEIRTFPGRFWHWLLYSDLQVRPTYEATASNAEHAPTVNFDSKD